MDIEFLLQNLTLEEKASLCSGENFWWTKGVERLDVSGVMVTDGPHGLRKQSQEADHLGVNDSIKAVCFPSGAGLAASFNRDLIANLGDHLGKEARCEKVHTVLGPAINMKRSPLCGRNFEYLSEDPYLAGEMSASYVNAVQANGVGVSVKHYAANNQEYRRMSTDTIVDEQTLREIYLTAFEKTVKQSKPWSLMCAYNRVNGTYCCENKKLLTDILRTEWGFDGIVMTDWGAMNNRVQAIKAGLELEMPSSNGVNDAKIVKAVNDGELSMEVVDTAVRRLLEWIDKGETADVAPYDKNSHHTFARKAAAECAVLLKNDNSLLPLSKADSVAFIGKYAEKPRFQGGGSSHINAFCVTNAVDSAKSLNTTYAQGWADDGETADAELFAKAVETAKNADVAVIFAGLPDSFESEGYDRKHMDLPACQNELIAAICAVQPKTVVVLHNGSPVTMPWVENANSILEMYLGGQAVGEATVDILFGDAEPCGRLAETFPLRLEDTPSYLTFLGNGHSVRYDEGIYIGYRWYDSRSMKVLFPFGHGLSYTSFELSNATLSSNAIKAGEKLTVTVDVTNTGKRSGSEVVQVYVAPPKAANRAVHELKGFTKISLNAGETKTVSLQLDERSFAMYETRVSDWYVPAGEYTVQIGTSSRNLPLQLALKVSNAPLPLVFSDYTTIADLIESGHGELISSIMQSMSQSMGGTDDANEDVINPQMMQSMMEGMPLHSLTSFSPEAGAFINEIKSKLC